MVDAGAVIDRFGGDRALAAHLNCARSTVTTWRKNGIPHHRCVELADLARARRLRGLTLRRLMVSATRTAAHNADASATTST